MRAADAAAAPPIDLSAYLARVGLDAPPPPTAEGLAALHLAHATHVPFENLDVLLRRPIALDAPSLVAKLVDARRGGYCFEQNTLFAHVLRALGFRVTMLAARVRYRATRVLPRTHMLLAVDVDGDRLVADVGFGGEGLLLPMPLAEGASSQQYAWRYRLSRDDGGWVMQAAQRDRWQDLYAFTLEPYLEPDFEMASWYVSTHPESRFVRTLAVQRPTPQARYTLRNREFIVDRGDGDVSTTRLADDAIVRTLRETFGLAWPEGTPLAFDETFR